MRRFKFKLRAVLKMREFKEKKIEIELGKILARIHQVKNEIMNLKKDIAEAYDSQERVMKQPLKAKTLEFYPYYIRSKHDHILAREKTLETLDVEYQNKIREMQLARGEVKTIDNMKDRQFQEYRREYHKKEQQNIEEWIVMKGTEQE